MKTVGIIGGLSWESTLLYYRFINEAVRKRLGGLHSAKCLIHSFDFSEIEALTRTGKWGEATGRMISAARSLEKAGADFIVIASNTLHKVAEEVESAIGIPLLHIADAAGEGLEEKKIQKIGLLGTRITMENSFLKDRLQEDFGIESVIPSAIDRELIHKIIYEELCVGKVTPLSRDFLRVTSEKLAAEGAEGILLGCTELGLLLPPGGTGKGLPAFDTAQMHVKAILERLFS